MNEPNQTQGHGQPRQHPIEPTLVSAPVSIAPVNASVEYAFIDAHTAPLQADLDAVVQRPYTTTIRVVEASSSKGSSLRARAEAVSAIHALLYNGLLEYRSDGSRTMLSVEEIRNGLLDMAQSAACHSRELEKTLLRLEMHHQSCERLFTQMLTCEPGQHIALDQTTIDQWQGLGLVIDRTEMSHLELTLALATVNQAIEKQHLMQHTALTAKLTCLHRLRFWAHLIDHIIDEAKALRERVEPDWSKPLPRALRWLDNAIQEPVHQIWAPATLEGVVPQSIAART